MPTFAYRARTEQADDATGVLDAEDLKAAAIRLRAQGLYPVTIEVQKGSGPSSARGQTPTRPTAVAGALRLSSSERALLAQQLSQALTAGVPLVKALDLVARHSPRRLGLIAAAVHTQILAGVAVADALATLPGAFPPSTVALVRAGEAGGGLDEALRRIAELAERDAEVTGRVRAALVYPAIVLGLGIVTLIVLLTVAVPQVAAVFRDLNTPLPWSTRVVLAISRRLPAVGLTVAGVAAAIGLVGRRRRWGRRLAEGLVLGARRLPFVRTVLMQADLARWTQTVGLLIGQGVTVTAALAFGQAVVTQPAHQRATRQIAHDVVEGLPLSQALARAGMGDPFLQMLVTVGEAEGDLARTLLQAAQTYTRAVDRAVKTAGTLIEPLLIVVVGLVVGAIAFAMLLPVFQMSEMIS